MVSGAVKRVSNINTRTRRIFRAKMMTMQGNRCCYCAGEFDDNRWGDRYATIEHIEDRARGGKNERANLALACAKCNQRAAREAWSVNYKRARIRAANVVALADLVVEHMELPPAFLSERAA